MAELNSESFNEQVEFFKMLANKLELSNVNLHNEDCIRCFSIYFGQRRFDEKSINFLNKELDEYITTGKLDNWVKDNINDDSIEKLVNIHFFWNCYCHSASCLGIEVPSDFTDEELEMLENVTPDDIKSYYDDTELVDNDDLEMRFLREKHAYQAAVESEYIKTYNLKGETWLEDVHNNLRGSGPRGI